MNAIKKILTLLMLVVVVFAFFISVTQMPAKAEGTFCTGGGPANTWCWTSIPTWMCTINPGAIRCDEEPE